METQEKDKLNSSDEEVEPAIQATGYECLEPEMGSVVLDYFNGSQRERKEEVALHLRLSRVRAARRSPSLPSSNGPPASLSTP
jgi:hypothetical protein